MYIKKVFLITMLQVFCLFSSEEALKKCATMTMFYRGVKNINIRNHIDDKILFSSIDIQGFGDCDDSDKIYLGYHASNKKFLDDFRRIDFVVNLESNKNYCFCVDTIKRCIDLQSGHYKLVVDGNFFYYDQVFSR